MRSFIPGKYKKTNQETTSNNMRISKLAGHKINMQQYLSI